MKSHAKKIVLSFLLALARIRLKRLGLFVIGVTGSVGKTSTKEAIYTILRSRYPVYRSEKSYNTEFGLPLAILEQTSGFSSPLKWIKVMLGAVWNAFFGGRKMQMLVVEMGTDKPGDMMELLKLVHPQVGVLTSIKPVHLAEGQFKDLEDIFNEKKRLAEALPEKGVAVLNADDPYIATLRDKLACRKIMYGVSELADLRLLAAENSDEGLAFEVSYQGKIAQGVVPILGVFHAYVVLPALAVALSQGFELEEAVAALKDYHLPPGRLNPVEGINNTLIIDSSYNASPETVKEALDVLKGFSGRKIAVLGNMNELGTLTEKAHRDVGRYAAGRADVLISVGEHAKNMGAAALNEAALTKGTLTEANVAHFDNALAAAGHLKEFIRNGDTILVKGSQNKVRLEKLVKALMKNPDNAPRLLARQGSEWEKID